MSTVVAPLGIILIVLIVAIPVKYLRKADLKQLVKTWEKYEMIKLYNEMYLHGGLTRDEYLEKIKELEENG